MTRSVNLLEAPLENPIFLRELSKARRDWRVLVGAGIWVLLAAAVAWMCWADPARNWEGATAVLASATSIMAVIVAGLSAATSIAREREAQTWDAVLLTRMSPLELALGYALITSIWPVVMITISWLGILAATAGVHPEHLVGAAAWIAPALASAFYASCVGVWCSALTSRSSHAQLLVIALLAFAPVVPLPASVGFLYGFSFPPLAAEADIPAFWVYVLAGAGVVVAFAVLGLSYLWLWAAGRTIVRRF